MHFKFVQTANVTRFLSAISVVENRMAAPEASFLLVSGDAGHGKSHTARWWATQTGAVLLRLKAAATPHWLLSDLVTELGECAPAHSCEKMFAQAIESLARNPRAVVVDEAENGLGNIAILDTIRDVSDLTEVPVILVGREYVWGKLRRHKQIETRISSRVDFTPLALDDVQKCVDELCEVEVSPEVVSRIHKHSGGYTRDVLKAIENVERVGKKNGRAVDLNMIGKQPLTHAWKRRAA